MVGEHDTPAARREHIDGQVEAPVQDLQLGVDLDADGLEDPLGRMTAATPRRCGDGIPRHIGQLAGGRQGPGSHDGGGDATREPPLAVGGEEPGQVGLG